MKSSVRLLSLILVLAPASALAQTNPADCPMHAGHSDAQASPAPAPDPQAQHQHAGHVMSPYAGKEGSEVKALSAEEMQAYRDGTGMGMAKPAELNHYPGPRHVLDLAADLKVTDSQKAELQAVFRRMHEDAVVLGGKIIEKEKALDSGFASGSIDEKTLRRLTSEIASLQAELRAAHLKAHLATKRILTAEQVARYDELRGYARS
ncbi:MAG TPA: Spy/CpxP family protein refolding chaperone [Thermoanaerobaculia bacterium]|nr:Spy/CpxP family protein refolding chaperone [Thermoanaerobaculia bacterium]